MLMIVTFLHRPILTCFAVCVIVAAGVKEYKVPKIERPSAHETIGSTIT